MSTATPSAVSGAVSSPAADPSTPSGEARAPLTPDQKRAELAARRKARAAKIKAKREAARQRAAARREAQKTTAAPDEGAPAPDELEAPPVGAPPARSDEEVGRDLATLIGLLWSLLGFAAGFVGWRLKPLTAEDKRRGADAFLPVARAYPAFMSATWLAIPLWFVATVTEKAERKPKEPTPAGSAGGA